MSDLPSPTPVFVPLKGRERPLPVMAFCMTHSEPSALALGIHNAPLSNRWPTQTTLVVCINGVCRAFKNAEMAYLSLKDSMSSHLLKACTSVDSSEGVQALEMQHESKLNDEFQECKRDNSNDFDALLTVLRVKWRMDGYREFLLATGRSLLIEHCEDEVW